MSSKKLVDFSPGRVVILSLLSMIVVGVLLLSLPSATTKPIALIDLFFTTTSFTCVTGLLTVSLDSFSFFGQCILLCIMQIGGLGIITLTLLFMYLIAELGLATQLMAGQLLEIDSWPQIKKLLIFITLFTISIELIATVLLFPTFYTHHSFAQAVFFSFFHAVSIFCNAGVWLAPDTDIQIFLGNGFALTVMAILILISDIGFMAWYELYQKTDLLHERKKIHLSLQSKIVFHATLLIVSVSTLLFLCLEWTRTLARLPFLKKIGIAFFNGNSMRSTGMIFDQTANLHPGTSLLAMLLAFVGAAPLSTGSGVKITTVAVFLAMIRSVLNSRFAVEIKGRTIPFEQAQKACAIIFLTIAWIFLSSFCLLLVQPNLQIHDVLFETTMAITNVGISSGLTQQLSTLGKLIIMITMIIGRIGSVTLLLAILSSKTRKVTDFSYPEERVTFG
ncbi:hypothetical protein IPH25_04615 [bacterium]|nr:MAG: hypothetical protein IPG37_01610 [bacterium]QQR61724.1 MAG: hypothetical protein IPH25_04615 [bacterium]QQR62708.1 MAG: hypothetical protein IPH67_04820 [bacterium]